MNTLAPPYWPTWIRDPENPDYSKPDLPNVLVPQTHEHIGDKLSKKNVDWAWYAGAWQATLEQFKDSGGIPKIPNFQYHHQPFNYFKQQGPQNRAEREKRLRDGGLGDESSTNKFFTAAHRQLPFGTQVKVTNVDNDKSVVVRINDRGPHTRGRLIDLSRKAAEQLGKIGRASCRERV